MAVGKVNVGGKYNIKDIVWFKDLSYATNPSLVRYSHLGATQGRVSTSNNDEFTGFIDGSSVVVYTKNYEVIYEVSISNAWDLVVDDGGSVYILTTDGYLKKVSVAGEIYSIRKISSTSTFDFTRMLINGDGARICLECREFLQGGTNINTILLIDTQNGNTVAQKEGGAGDSALTYNYDLNVFYIGASNHGRNTVIDCNIDRIDLELIIATPCQSMFYYEGFTYYCSLSTDKINLVVSKYSVNGSQFTLIFTKNIKLGKAASDYLYHIAFYRRYKEQLPVILVLGGTSLVMWGINSDTIIYEQDIRDFLNPGIIRDRFHHLAVMNNSIIVRGSVLGEFIKLT